MIKVGHVTYVSMRLDKTDSVTPFPRFRLHFLKGNLQKLVIFPWPLRVTSGDLLGVTDTKWTQSKPGLLLRTTHTTDYHQPHLDISTQFVFINRKRSQRHLPIYACLYVAKNYFYRRNAVSIFAMYVPNKEFRELHLVFSLKFKFRWGKWQTRLLNKRSNIYKIKKFKIENFKTAKSFYGSLRVQRYIAFMS